MTHVFIAPHPDDVALSCGGLIAGLRELGQAVTIVTVFSGGQGSLTDYQRTALGFGTKAMFPDTVAFRRTNVPADLPVPVGSSGAPAWAADPGRVAVTQELANLQARQFWQRAAWTRSANVTALETEARPLADSVAGQGSLEDLDLTGADIAEVRRIEDERYAYFAECSTVWLDLPDAVYRGYAGDDELLDAPREDDDPPYEALRREILRLEPQMVYAPLAVGNHVDHQLCREAILAMLDEERGWVMPAPSFAGRVSFYEDFPYAWWHDFSGPAQLPAGALALRPGLALEARYTDITDQLDRKIAGVALYESQLPRLFESEQQMLDAFTTYGARIAREGGIEGYAERYWAVVPV